MTLAYVSRHEDIPTRMHAMFDIYRMFYPCPVWMARMPQQDAVAHCRKWRGDWCVPQGTDPIPF